MPTALSSATPPPSPGSAPLQFQHLAFITVRIKSAALRHTEPLGTSLPRKPPSQRSQPAAARATAAGPPRAAGPAPPHGLPPPPERGVTSAMGAESRPSPRPGYLAVSLPSPLTPRQDRYRRLGSARLGPARPGSARLGPAPKPRAPRLCLFLFSSPQRHGGERRRRLADSLPLPQPIGGKKERRVGGERKRVAGKERHGGRGGKACRPRWCGGGKGLSCGERAVLSGVPCAAALVAFPACLHRAWLLSSVCSYCKKSIFAMF